MSEATAQDSGQKPGMMQVLRSMGQVKTGYMAIFGFASGLPFALFLGTLYAWLSEAEVDLETMGVFSLIGLAYGFQFLWSPAIDKINLPLFRQLGRRKQWMVPMQLLLGAILVTLSL
ncbi:MAG: MFS transporter, partial [Pseudomonadota bacterium]